MAVLTAAVIVVGLLCVLDLLLTFGVIRRLRKHTELLNSHSGDAATLSLAPGDLPPSFTATDADGTTLSGPAGLRVVAFFSASCSVCPLRAPDFVAYVRDNQLPRDAALAVLLADEDASVPYADQLAEVATLTRQAADGELATAFGVLGYPAFCVLDADGAVQATSFNPAELPALVPA
jgi:hypothetical protein